MSDNHFDVYDNFDINTIEDTNYRKKYYPKEAIDNDDDIKIAEQKVIDGVLEEVKKIIRFVRTGTTPRFVYKSARDKGGHGVEVMPYDDVKKLLSTVELQGLPKIKVGGQMKPMNLWQLVDKNKRELRVNRLCFNSHDPDAFNTFSGYKYQPLEDYDESLIQLHLQHWKNILCSGNDDQYTYMINWCARLLKFPDERNRTGLVLLSKQGTGKNTFFTDHLVNIIGDVYACYESNANNIFGEFNKKIENKHLVICNEMVDAENAARRQSINYDRLKSTMNDPTISIRVMRTDAYDVDNVFNLIVVSNNGMPFRIDDEDRRLVFLDVSNKYAALKDSTDVRNDPEAQKLAKERKAYFDALVKEMKHPLFLQTLYSYLLDQYDENWDPENDKPLTKAKEVILERSANPLQEFIEMHIHEISCEKWSTVEAYNKYKDYCTERGHKFISNMPGFLGDLKQKYDIDKRRKESSGNRLTVLYLTDDGKKRYAKLLDEKNDDDNDDDWDELAEFKDDIPADKRKKFLQLLEKLRN